MALHRRGDLLRGDDNLAREFRTRMEGLTRIAEPAIDRIQTASDGTKKVLFRIEDGLFIKAS